MMRHWQAKCVFLNLTDDTEDVAMIDTEVMDADFNSILLDWGEACQQSFLTTLMSTTLMAGALSGSFIAGWLADAYGRLLVLKGCLLLVCVVNGVFSFLATVSWLLSAAFLFTLGAGCGGYMQMWVVESCRWLAGVHRIAEARSTAIQVMSRRSGAVQQTNEWQWWEILGFSQPAITCPNMKETSRKYTYSDLFSHPAVYAPLIALCYCFVSSSVVSFGFYFNADALPGNRYLNMAFMGVSKFALGLLPFAVSSFVGRRPIVSVSVGFACIGAWLAVISQLLGASAGHWSLVALSLLVSAALDPAWKINHLYSAELFPTVVRNMARAVCNVGARLGSVAAPMLIVVAAFIPETKGKPLPEELPYTDDEIARGEQMLELNPSDPSSLDEEQDFSVMCLRISQLFFYGTMLPHRPVLDGPTAVNEKLQGVAYILKDKIEGPESLVVEGDSIYTGLYDGRVVHIKDGKIVTEVRFTKQAKCGNFRHIVKSNVPIDGRYMRFVNDVELHPDRRSILFAECNMARIGRLNLETNEVTPFALNLPGLPDNIRQGAGDTLWVGMAGVRHAGAPSVIDAAGPYPLLRQIFLDFVPEYWWIKHVHLIRPRHAMVIQLNADGEIIQSLHDTKGTHIQDVSQVSQSGDYLFFGSFHNRYIAKLYIER
ncbi:hypothetical protein ANCCEY_01891 [Ancylostoma ceylanicum]|uniref:Major facilitator superfamily (MFS) profile domain-containing protein n=1 Tax=Ancylostoma ceylanicum TaxID=53326 RepID=A0A0D6M4F3_9BILA|nr:hypothetical protein ANCCEY_01891 [Ancylostoma ceylanicum]